MYESSLIGIPKRITAAGVTVVSSVGNPGLIGVCCTPSVTGATTIQIWAGVTATGTAVTGVITFVSSTAAARFVSVPAYCSGGCVVNVAGDANPDITLFWNPE